MEIRTQLEKIGTDIERALDFLEVFASFTEENLMINEEVKNYDALALYAFEQLPPYLTVFFAALRKTREASKQLNELADALGQA